MILSYASVTWNLRQPPLATASADERARWCRDHCGRFAARWFALGAGLWLIFSTPFVSFAPLGMFGLFALVVGMATIARQILAQGRAGPPHIEPPVDFPRPDHEDDDER
ncbi:hypothetical protein [Spiribacter vilamensis]|uniref:hypothetical protein n=1 Tax=Spiribacter vilamensis TaxID=531306 RepID=UPI00102B7EA2|nr:hypothetical protein [Spiribacter vilamensis]TVO61971.1 hypothetical protein FPL09_07690 [Spiribacter vilamensis]